MRNTTSKLFFSFLYPSLFVAVLWGIKLFEVVEQVNLSWYGIYPRKTSGLIGIVTAPLLHGDFPHLISNTLPLLVLGPIIFYFYRTIAFNVFFWVYVMTGVWVWAAGANGYHIGASGIIYGFITFLFFSGIFRKDPRLMALSLFVTFLYGGAIWGIFPLQQGVSWQPENENQQAYSSRRARLSEAPLRSSAPIIASPCCPIRSSPSPSTTSPPSCHHP